MPSSSPERQSLPIDADPRGRAFRYEGEAFRLDLAPEARRRDLERRTATVVRLRDGERLVIDARDFNLPPLDGLEPPAQRFEPRPLVERMLELGFDETWCDEILRWVRRHRLFEERADATRGAEAAAP
ncbi:MAG TPA: hypothetical protein VEI02_06235 [Planctomycetota bacterium]|nr:hypothetical protein [Planctomycetota bacterium]